MEVDELILGSIPLKLNNWDETTIVLFASGDEEYLELWLAKDENNTIGRFDIRWTFLTH